MSTHATVHVTRDNQNQVVINATGADGHRVLIALRDDTALTLADHVCLIVEGRSPPP